jgi:hypothetical protein
VQSAETLLLTNPHDRDVCFKVKTTAPRRYCVRPNAARIPPKQTVKVEVLAQAMDRYPSDDNCKDKFLVQMAWLPDKNIGAYGAPSNCRAPPVIKRLCSHAEWWSRAADVIEHWKDLSALAEQKGKDNKPYAEKKLKSILEIPGRPATASSRASPPVSQLTPAGAPPPEAYNSVRSSPAATPQVQAAPAGDSEVDRLRAQLSQAQAALKKGGGDGVKKVELMYAVMAVLLAFIFGYFL